jgi:ribonuclease HII
VKLATFALEEVLWERHETVVACDEVGRGSYAGPVEVGVCATTRELAETAPMVADSKLLRPSMRATLAVQIQNWAPTAVGAATAREIDEMGMAAALRLAASRALAQLQAAGVTITCVMQDGSASWLPETIGSDVECLIQPKLDLTSATCAAASIVAKEHRDELMREIGSRYPLWPAIASSAGYGTKAHEEQILLHGLCDEHRKSWSFAERLAPGGT